MHAGPPQLPSPTSLEEVRVLKPRIVVHETREGKLWNRFSPAATI